MISSETVTRASGVALAAAALVAVFVPQVSAAKERISKAKAARELAQLYAADQKDQENWETLNEEDFAKRQEKHRDRAFEFVHRGLLSTPRTYHDAAFLFLHGRDSDDVLLSHVLATACAFQGERMGHFVSAAALDRYLLTLRQPQRFKSQGFGGGPGFEPQHDEHSLSEVVVHVFDKSGLFGVPAEKPARAPAALGRASKTLAKLAGKEPFELTTETTEDQFGAAEQIVRAGSLGDADAFLHAGAVLTRAESADRRVLAHILVIAAALQGRRDAVPFSRVTLDRVLIALKRPPIFEAGEHELPEVLQLHESIRAVFEGDPPKRGGKKRRNER